MTSIDFIEINLFPYFCALWQKQKLRAKTLN